MSNNKRQLQLEGVPADLERISALLDEVCEDWGLEPASCFDLQLAVEEASTNVIEHAYRGRGGRYQLVIEARGEDVVITIQDHGRRFDPSAVRRPNLSLPLQQRPVGGLGIHLMQQLMDHVEYSFSATDGNTLTMVKRNAVSKGQAGAP